MNRLERMREMIRSRVLLRASDGARIIAPNGSLGRWTYDFRTVALDPEWLDMYAEEFWNRFTQHLPFQVGGLETASIPLIAAIVTKSRERGTPVSGFYIRKTRDKDGLLKRVEGTLTDEKVVLVDDLMNSGGSFHKQLAVLDSLQKKVSDIFVVLAFRAPEAYTFASERGIRAQWLFTLEDFGQPLEPLSKTSKDTPRAMFDIRWKFAPGNPAFEWVVQKSAPAIDDTRVYFGSDNGVFYALDQESGAIVWSFRIGSHPEGKGIFSSPVVHEGTVYFGGYDGNMYALDAATGTVRWIYSDADWIGSSPAIAPDLGLLFIGLEFGLWHKRGGIAALDLKTGKQVWRDRTLALTHGSPLYIKEEKKVIIGSNDAVAYAYDAKTGERSWTHLVCNDIKTRPAYDPKRRLILIPSMDAHLYALDSAHGDSRWGVQTGAGIYSNPLVDGDRVFVASLDKSLYSIDLNTGKRLASFATAGRIFASPTLADDSLWIGSNDGRLYELEPDTLKIRGSHQFSERIVNAVAYNPKTKRFFIPTVANELYCATRLPKEGART